MTTEPTSAPAAPTAPPPAAPASFETRHDGTFHGTGLAYRCLAAETHLPDAKGEPRASVFSFSYLVDDAAPETRPVTFVFNGGPGSASLWLHMGALGPRRIVVPSDGTPAGSGPYGIVDNELCNLDKTDLVFVDPPGTGYSRMLGAAKPEDAWGLDADAELVAEFIKTWLTVHRRWASPRYLCGESYGTTRAVAVAGKLAGGLAGVAFNGIALISAILDFHTARFERGNPLADVSFMPTYAATALHYGLATAPDGRDAFLDEARRFAMEEYLPALVAGSRLAPARQQRVLRKLSRLTGLSETWLERTRLRIEPTRFRKELLRDTGLTVGRFDTRYTGRDYDDAGELPDTDASSYAVDSAYVTAINDHLTRGLGIGWNRPYMVFNREALLKWDWLGPRKDDTPRWPGYVNVAPVLGKLLRENPGLRVLMANGLYDLATPFHAAENTIAGNGIDAGRIAMTYYDAGHMMYLHEPSLGALVGDLRAWMG
ncbi:S10 family peptidase [Limobrevibacterium gyesilva]|uniref:Peptidase S10 n=1 Tax=Limobrevibacterium gyesilva TaxID=2991712 RepID=A0AA42CJL2_9PROT|nr:peptidase S10 [Limobrevibacterium gyesilva]MCW3477017.1 peptidase S10 [Limobrevibacterium gyesilva]